MDDDKHVLLHKKLSFSDLADTVLQTGRIVLPRNQMEVNAEEIITIANTGARNVNPDNGKATYELTVTDVSGRQWPLLLKQWTANSTQNPRPIFVLERTSQMMKAHRASPGHFLQAYTTIDDPNTLRVHVFSPHAVHGAAVAAAAAPSRPSEDGRQQQQSERHRASGIDYLLQVASQQEEQEQQQKQDKEQQDTANKVKFSNFYASSTTPAGMKTTSPTSPPPPPPPPPPAAAAAPGTAAAGAGYILGKCQRSSECYKEAGHPGFCSTGYKTIVPTTTKTANDNNNSSNLHTTSAAQPSNFNLNLGQQYSNPYTNPIPATTTTTNNNNTRNSTKIDYFGRHDDQDDTRSPAAALNAAAQKFRADHQHAEALMNNTLPSASGSYFKDIRSHPFHNQRRSRQNTKRNFHAPLNAPLYLASKMNPDSAVAKNIQYIANGMTLNTMQGSIIPPPPPHQHGGTGGGGDGVKTETPGPLSSPFSQPQAQDTSLQQQQSDDGNNRLSPGINQPQPQPPLIVSKPQLNSTTENIGEVCPTWITIQCGVLRGDLHVPSMMVTVFDAQHTSNIANNSTAPVSVRAFQLMAKTMHLGTKHRVDSRYVYSFKTSEQQRSKGTVVETGDVIMVEGAGMSLERWLKSWDLPVPQSHSAAIAAAAAAAVAASLGGSGGSGVIENSSVAGGGSGDLQTPLSYSGREKSPIYHPSSRTTEERERLPKQQQQHVARSISDNALAAAMAATEAAIAQAEAAGRAAAARASVEVEEKQQEAASPFIMEGGEEDDGLISGGGGGGDDSNDSDIEAGEVLLSMMGIADDRRPGRKRERAQEDLQPLQQQQQRQKAKSQQQQYRRRQWQEEEPKQVASVLIKPTAVWVTTNSGARLFNALLTEKIEAQTAAAATAAHRPTTAASATIAMWQQYRYEATQRANKRLDELSKRAKVAKMLAVLAHLKFPRQF